MITKMLLTNLPVQRTNVLAAVLLDPSGMMQDCFLYPAEDGTPEPGEIYLAVVEKMHRQTDGVFLRISGGQMIYMPLRGKEDTSDYCVRPRMAHTGRRTGVNPSGKNAGKLRAGDELLVQIDTAPLKTKRPHAEGELNLSGRFLAVTTRDPGLHFSRKLGAEEKKRIRACLNNIESEADIPSRKSFGCIVRTNAADAPEEALKKELADLCTKMNRILTTGFLRPPGSCLYRPDASWIHLLDRMQFSPDTEILTDLPEVYDFLQAHLDPFSEKPSLRLYTDTSLPLCKLYNLERRLTRLTEKRVWLKSGAMIIIEPTEAFVSVDVNTGKNTGAHTKEETAFRINMEASAEVLRQIRLRQLSGAILIDFINMREPAHNQALMQRLRELAADDPVPTKIIDLTPLGIVEVTREKRYRPLSEQI